ncbi:MAG: thiamine phosphate synthase [Propionibacteriales bacterium]|nr:thiamine phosphate synthase [Propionibacteriales bacterium]
MTVPRLSGASRTPETASGLADRLLIFTDRRQLPAGRQLVDSIAAAVEGGARQVVLRERDLPAAERERLAAELADVVHPAGGRLFAAAPGVDGCDGVQLRAAEPMPSPRPAYVGRSCHDSVELDRAARERCDHVTLSPVAVTASKPGYGPALGRAGLRGCLDAVPDHPPVFALGGVTPANALQWRAGGAYGVAVMGGVMRAADPAVVVAALLDALAVAQ